MVRFCPVCGAPMVPKSSEGNMVILKCVRCGHEVKVEKSSTNYKLKFQVEADKRTATSKAVEARKTGMTPEEREMLQEYYEIFLESFQEETSEE